MKDIDKARFKLAMHLFEITFNAEFDNAKLAGYFMALEDLPIEAIESATKESIRNEKRTPPPAVIREYANKFRPAITTSQQIPQFSYKDIRPTSALGKECMKNIHELFDGRITKAEFEENGIEICQRNNVDYEYTDCPY